VIELLLITFSDLSFEFVPQPYRYILIQNMF